MCTRIRKGIINPNYPGFQSLAYTLNDDNFDYSSENPSDDDEDSYVSESDDNEMKRQVRCQDERDVGDENGNSFGGVNDGEESGEKMPLHSCVGGTVDASLQGMLSLTAYPQPVTTTLESEESYQPDSPIRCSRTRLIPTGYDSPMLTTTTALFGPEEKLDSTCIYASTPPDIVLQHSYELRTSALGSTNEFLKTSVEQSNTIQRPDLIPEQQRQLQEQHLLQQDSKLGHDDYDGENHNAPVYTECDEVVDDGDDEDEDEGDDEDDEDQDGDGNRTPPSPAVERAIGSISNSNSATCSSNFLRNGALSPDQMLDETARCYGSVTDVTLSDDSEQESDEGEFEYHAPGADSDNYALPADTAGSPDDSTDSVGSSPGEVQYHLVDDCSNQTVQITRSRQFSEHSPTNQYHLLQQYSSPVGSVDSDNNQAQREDATEREINRNTRYCSLEHLAQGEPSCTATDSAFRGDRIANQDELVSTDYPDDRSMMWNVDRSGTIYPIRSVPTVPRVNTTPSGGAKISEVTQATGSQGIVPVNQYQKVPKVNPFCELLLQETDTCDFFTKQAKLQIEARMALCQAKDMAHMQMEIEKRSMPLSPVTRVIHTAVEKAGLSLATDKRRLSRYYLTRLNVHQLQTILTVLQGHAEVQNEELVELLMERDELHISQDATLIDIEDLSRYLCAKEQTIIHAERQRKSYHYNSNRTAHQKQSSLAQPQLRTACGTTIPAYRYH
ncbi:schwannomin-interacting protein 1-like [Anopheles nili]|uniref:schwannomin-interacting protein 1-like n=1 Tax=Anopheles nili TaxID=185578 RepID=UPI00237ADE6D|nr:schwannomin-interacting protein 1-like [Anopheles nili]